MIFDGFDEYILRNEGRVTVADALDQLNQLVQSTGARIVITSRTSFWKSNVAEGNLSDSARHAVYTIRPFDVPVATKYFVDRFAKDRRRVDKAVGVYGPLATRDPQFIGRGFVLKLVGDLVADGGMGANQFSGSGIPMRWLVEAFCEREVTRQELPISARQQLRVLETFAAEVAMGAEPDSEALELCVLEAAPDLTLEDRTNCIERLKPHPLLGKQQRDDRWKWTEEQVGNVFLAQWLCRLATTDTDLESRHLRKFLARQSLSAGGMNDLAAMVVGVAAEGHGGTSVITDVVRRVLEAARASGDDGGSTDGRTLAAVLALRTVDHVAPEGSSRQGRATRLLQVLGGSPIRGIAFAGTISAMDLSGVEFVECRFDRVVWANVVLDDDTVFERCHFVGGIAERTDGIGLCNYRNCTWDAEARATIRAAQSREGKRRYGREDLKGDIAAVVRKFVNRSGFLQTVETRNLSKGVIRGSKFCEEIIEALRSGLLENHSISGVKGGGWHVKEEAVEAVRFFANNGVMTGRLKEIYEATATKLGIDE